MTSFRDTLADAKVSGTFEIVLIFGKDFDTHNSSLWLIMVSGISESYIFRNIKVIFWYIKKIYKYKYFRITFYRLFLQNQKKKS